MIDTQLADGKNALEDPAHPTCPLGKLYGAHHDVEADGVDAVSRVDLGDAGFLTTRTDEGMRKDVAIASEF